MKARGETSIAQLRGPILRSVSRSFYLSIRLLPAKLRDPIALAYLLARATDTIADAAEIDRELRICELANLAAAIQGESTSFDSLDAFGAQQENEAERALLQAIPTALAWLVSFPMKDRDDIRDVLAKINRGQTLDVERFGDARRATALRSAAELDEYTYLVAGCVGEFWTKICFRHLPNFATRSRDEMLSSGVSYGKGLQLINILRDIGADLRAGRCYLPQDELGLSPNELLRDPAAALPVLQSWRVRAEQGIAAGIDYTGAIRNTRVRIATALPALIGARTLALLREAGASVFETKIKVRRSEVRRILFGMLASFCSRSHLRRAFEQPVSGESLAAVQRK